MPIAEDMCSITLAHADEKLRYFVRADPDDGDSSEVDVLHLREDLDWTDRRQREVESELLELVASESYEELMGSENVNQIIKVADTKILFTGFVDDVVVIAAFERGILPALPTVVADFREYMRDNDVSFIALDA
ncbi:hypothetical protein M0R88_03220 [Halorussus gelatinilyticus]|uniref:Uncharacterized protein n=1 Tax=Halorussus gelatinilyticus TaxID=2937524 RepID=A0A8U0IJ42_9EURY|nr:hypothetical protein [Halorussus gelatinilyticus]UPW01120.1 hypothetical protein M0R88_03220 [Halorussus gelatinilyticus]